MRSKAFFAVLLLLIFPLLASAQHAHFVDAEPVTITGAGLEVQQIAVYNPTSQALGLSIFSETGLEVQQPHYGIAYPEDTLRFWLITDPEVPPGNTIRVFVYQGDVEGPVDTLDVLLNIGFSDNRDVLQLSVPAFNPVKLFAQETITATLTNNWTKPIEILGAFMIGDDHQHYSVNGQAVKGGLQGASTLELSITYSNNGYQLDPYAKLAVRYSTEDGKQVALLPIVASQQPIIEAPTPDDLGNVPSGLYVFSEIDVANNFTDSIHLEYGTGSGNFMTFLTPTKGPTVNIPPGTSKVLLQHYIDGYGDGMESYVLVEPWSSTSPFHHDPFPISFAANGRYWDGADTAFYPVFAKQTTATPLVYDEEYGYQSHHRYTYYNDSGDSLTVTRLEVLGSAHWTILEKSFGPAPFRMGPNDKFFVEYELNKDTSIIYEALIIETDGALPLPWQAIKGAKDPTVLPARVESIASPIIDLRVYPNPATDHICISASDFVIGQVVLSDAVGKSILRIPFSGTTSIDIAKLFLSNGQYFLTFTGRNSRGELICESKPFTIAKH